MVTSWQIREIHILKNIIALSEERYRKMLRSFDVCTSKDLTETEANVLIDSLKIIAKSLAKRYQKKYEDLAGRDTNMATPAQLRKMEVVWKEICKDKTAKIRKITLRSFLKKKFHVDDVRFLTKERARKIIGIMENKLLETKFLKAI